MAYELIANPPSFELACKLVQDAPAPKRVPITAHVRTAIAAVLGDREHYAVFVRYFKKGEVTGNTQADLYAIANLLVRWEAEAGRTEMSTLLAGDPPQIRLVDIVKRLAPELRRYNFDVQRGVIVGTLIGKIESPQAA